jgi:Family of unknown function (DUF6529)
MVTDAGETRTNAGYAFAALAVGAVVAVALGVYGREHTPSGEAIVTFGFGGLASMKVWLSVIVAGLAVVQLTTALWMYGYLGTSAPRSLGIVHRTSGAVAVVVSLPVAFHCLWSLGFQSLDTRVLLHSLAGCVFYGAFVAKVIGLHARRAPGWLVPLTAGLLLASLVLVVATGAGWYVSEFGWPSRTTGY